VTDDVEALAERMYSERVSSQGRGPTWEQLGDVTRGVWRGYAQVEIYGEFA
jgi:hypothetical protein